MPQSGKNVFISTSTFGRYDQRPLEALKAAGVACELNPTGRQLTADEIKTFLAQGVYSGLIAGTEPLNKEVLDQAVGLKVISRVGVGLDNVDREAARRLGIKVYNTPGVLSDSMAELTIALILDCLRKVSLMDHRMRVKVWKKEMGRLLKGKTLGIVGFGRVGQKVARLAKAFGAKVIFCDIKAVPSKSFNRVSLKGLLRNADIVSLHLSQNIKLITDKEIGLMKDGAILINTSRGNVIDEESLRQGLISGKIAFAAVDVFQTEPYVGTLLEMENVIVTPHIGSYAREARIEMEAQAVKHMLKGLRIRR